MILSVCKQICGQEGEVREGADELMLFSPSAPVYFSADRITYISETGIVTGEGAVEIVQDANKLEGDKVTINVPRELAEIEGNVVVTGEQGVIEGKRGLYDFNTREGVFYEARGFNDPWYVGADEIHRAPTGEYSVKELLVGRSALVFWIGVIVMGIILPMGISILSLFAGELSPPLLVLAVITHTIGAFSLKYCVLKVGIYRPVLSKLPTF